MEKEELLGVGTLVLIVCVVTLGLYFVIDSMNNSGILISPTGQVPSEKLQIIGSLTEMKPLIQCGGRSEGQIVYECELDVGG